MRRGEKEEKGGGSPSVLCRAGKRGVVVNVAPDAMKTAARTNATIKLSGMQHISSAIKGRREVRGCLAARGRGDDEKKRGCSVLLPLLPSPRRDM